MADGDNAEVVARKLFRPVATLCQALSYHDPEAASCEGAPPSSWPDSRIDRSQYNPGQGALLSPTTAVLLSGFTRAVAPWNGILIERTTGAAARVMSEDEVASVSRRSASRRTRHVLALANATDVLDLNIAQANLLAGVPVIDKASDILDKKIIPAYAQARLMKTPAAINQMLAAPPPNRALPGPNCVAGSEEWNTLCLMEASPTFAKNVVRALVLKRLKARGATINEWRQAIRSPSATGCARSSVTTCCSRTRRPGCRRVPSACGRSSFQGCIRTQIWSRVPLRQPSCAGTQPL